jgi:hypothetical protein
MIEILVGFFAIAIIINLLALFFTTDLGPVIIVLAIWSFIAYYLGKAVLSLI